MKVLKNLCVFLVLTILISSCNNENDPERTAKLEEAGKLHDQGLVFGKEVSDMLLLADTLLLKMNNEAIDSSEALLQAVNTAKEDYKAWQENLVEVPGHAHTHHEGEHHHHDHSMENASADEILKKQLELKEFIEDIHMRTKAAIAAVKIASEE